MSKEEAESDNASLVEMLVFDSSGFEFLPVFLVIGRSILKKSHFFCCFDVLCLCICVKCCVFLYFL